ncbi:DUF2797 domain-containing protein [Yinghuangia seranimata]|uniref:DUF2797 domain-containing protein n=1 Tax=Yinghuangia seranimata TaxID=408067 RepID=UPI00248B5EDC|nr:DUF2797 domain-containing protein [Yinghuangia seranimata]MDI2128004.1 DUF2797 domain-containing protein [Yinghuangia seranimata]
MTGETTTSADSLSAWRPVGLRWADGSPALRWARISPAATADSPTGPGAPIAFTVGADRRCMGVWRHGRAIPCPASALLTASSRSDQCSDCAALDRSSSVAADTRLDDPQPYRVYLAYHGPELVKVGITASARGTARLLEQGALSSLFIAEGPLPATRRAEHVLGSALGLPDRVKTEAKRPSRVAPGSAEERAARLTATRTAALKAAGWPESLSSDEEFAPIDHCPAYAPPESGIAPCPVVEPLVPGVTVAGAVAHAVGTDLYLTTAQGLVLLDVRLMNGWALTPASPDAAFTAPLRAPSAEPPPEPDALF